jgi:histidinol-phosphate aminotransferase
MSIEPNPCLKGVSAYRTPGAGSSADLRLDGNEGAGPEEERRYPDPRPLEERLARLLGVNPRRVLVTAGGDEAIDRICRAYLAPGRELIQTTPTFVMIARYAKLAGAEVVSVPWPRDKFPTDEVISQIGPDTRVICVVSPNNPTGATATADDLKRLSQAAPQALLLVDLAYTEFADFDLTQAALLLPNAVVVRSFSKAWGMAGLRVGYAAGPAEIIDCLRAAGGPYPVSRPSLARVAERLSGGVEPFVKTIKQERESLYDLLSSLGADPLPSQANFILCGFKDAAWVYAGLAALGILVRIFPQSPELEGCLRITCPGNPEEFARLCSALSTVLRPQGLLFDMDGVLADVSQSYRRAIIETAASYGVEIRAEEIRAAKTEGGSNNDWVLTQKLLQQNGVRADLAEVTQRFENLYQGTAQRPGLRRAETLLASPGLLESLSRRVPLGVVTGRPRADAERFLKENKVADRLSSLVCLEDAPLKPDPRPVRLALKQLGIERAWMIGDTPDDLTAARLAGVLPLGVLAPEGGDPGALTDAGAARVLSKLDELQELIP